MAVSQNKNKLDQPSKYNKKTLSEEGEKNSFIFFHYQAIRQKEIQACLFNLSSLMHRALLRLTMNI